jgi:hypothetical protein
MLVRRADAAPFGIIQLHSSKLDQSGEIFDCTPASSCAPRHTAAHKPTSASLCGSQGALLHAIMLPLYAPTPDPRPPPGRPAHVVASTSTTSQPHTLARMLVRGHRRRARSAAVGRVRTHARAMSSCMQPPLHSLCLSVVLQQRARLESRKLCIQARRWLLQQHEGGFYSSTKVASTAA